ncbi:thioredoxin family protein [Peptoniphilus sp. KCTC 25270]|uniref:thioredoxin family protein n=1 Tax=Peptoniphilus sp. KCTC 25270 TaxID=2897414 RepID=UPI00272C40F5|nr:thioredoxin family protein [Peptoniphilus sp. KCTC 25270]
MGFFKKKPSCENTTNGWVKKGREEKNTRVKILGSGCSSCEKLEKNTKEALEELGMKEEISHVRDFAEIAKYGVMSTPALVLDEKVLSYGKVLSKEEIKKIIQGE